MVGVAVEEGAEGCEEEGCQYGGEDVDGERVVAVVWGLECGGC